MVDQFLLVTQGPFHTFRLSLQTDISTPIDRWIKFLVRNGLRNFVLFKHRPGLAYQIPSTLFLYDGLTELWLFGCTLTPPASFEGFKNLRILYLNHVSFSEEGLSHLISNSTLLTNITLQNIIGCIRPKICALNLVVLDLKGPFQHIYFDKIPLLDKLSISIAGNALQGFSNGAHCKLVKLLGFLPGISKFEMLGDTFQILAAGDVPDRLSVSSKLSHVSLTMNLNDTQHVLPALCMFRSSSLLQTLVINPYTKGNTSKLSVEDFWKSKEDFNCWFSELRTLNVTQSTGSPGELKFIEFVLANAPLLQMVKIRLPQSADGALATLTKLVRFPRISSKAEIVTSR